MPLNNHLKYIRLSEYQMNSKEFAAKLGLKLSTYSNIERGERHARLETALEIASVLNKKVDDIWFID